MKYLFIFLFPILINAQEILTIDLNNDIQKQEIIVKKDTYKLEIITTPNIEVLEFKMNQSSINYEDLILNKTKDTIAALEGGNTSLDLGIKNLDFRDNSIYTFNIKIKKNDIVSSKTYVYKTQSSWNWSSTFGVNAIFLLNSDTYRTVENGMEYQITGDSGQNIIEYIPSVMFTYMDRSKNVSLGATAGLGFDLEQISVFGGISLVIGQNLILTGGIAFHNQERLDTKYGINETVATALSFDDLHTRYYRFNPFLSLSLRLDKPFVKSSGN